MPVHTGLLHVAPHILLQIGPWSDAQYHHSQTFAQPELHHHPSLNCCKARLAPPSFPKLLHGQSCKSILSLMSAGAAAAALCDVWLPEAGGPQDDRG